MGKRISIVYNYDKIYDYLQSISYDIKEMLIENGWEYMMIIKNISHSDLLSSGKRTGKNQSLEKNYLYYLSLKEMKELEEKSGNIFETAKQSNIFLPSEFYTFLNIPKLQRREGKQKQEHEHININKYANIFLVNETLRYFAIEYTKKIFEKLDKNPENWDYEKYKYELTDTSFTPIRLTHAIHGIGTSEDEIFQKIRRSIFKNDKIVFLIRKKEQKKEIYIILEKNPKFYSLIGECNESWEKYLENNDKKKMYELLRKDELLVLDRDEKTRRNQNRWRNLLAEEMMNYTANENEIFCPLTYITAKFDALGTLFRASHIKNFSSCSIEEAFDINNGIIMIANADALFDKHLISIENDGTIIYSYLLEHEYKLIQELRLNEKVFKSILNEKRKEYLNYHRNVFYSKEEKRKKSLDETDQTIF